MRLASNTGMSLSTTVKLFVAVTVQDLLSVTVTLAV